jgi:hypothetical protein
MSTLDSKDWWLQVCRQEEKLQAEKDGVPLLAAPELKSAVPEPKSAALDYATEGNHAVMEKLMPFISWERLPEHLGGHESITHTDTGALEWAISKFSAKRMIDVGCGPGGQVKKAQDLGLFAVGIDGDFTLQQKWDTEGIDVQLHDYTDGARMGVDGLCFDFAWSVEFLEHVEEKYISYYMHDFQLCKYVLCTAAPPGKWGHHHVNCQDLDYWINEFGKYGFIYDSDLSLELKESSTMLDDQPDVIMVGNNDFVKGGPEILEGTGGMVFENIFPEGYADKIHVEDLDGHRREMEKFYELWWL